MTAPIECLEETVYKPRGPKGLEAQVGSRHGLSDFRGLGVYALWFLIAFFFCCLLRGRGGGRGGGGGGGGGG